MKAFKYDVAGVCYLQAPLVLGQTAQLAKALEDFDLESFSGGIGEFIVQAGDRIPRLLAIVLTPDGVAKKDKDLDEIEEHLTDNMDLATMRQAVADFFDCNPIVDLLSEVEKSTGMIGEMVGRVMLKMLSSSYASSLLEATSQDETASSGDVG